MRRSPLFLLLSAACLGASAASAQSLDETLNLLLTGSAKDRLGLVEIEDAADCVVRLSNQKNADYARLRFNNVDPASIRVHGKPGRHFITFGGGEAIIELHDAETGFAGASGTVQISARDPQRERQAFERLYARFCDGRPKSTGQAGT